MTTQKDWQKKLPLWATNSRFFASAIIFAILLSPLPYREWWAALVFSLGSLTDWLDGYWARKYNAESIMGKFMDPIADKVLVLSALILLVYERRIDPVSPAILLSRDIFIGGIRSIAAASNVIIDAKPTGKWKTALQMIAIPCLMVGHFDLSFLSGGDGGQSTPLQIPFELIGRVILWISVVLSIISAIEYTRGYFSSRKGEQ